MKIIEIDKKYIINARKNDLIERGKYCLVYNYWGNIVKLDDCEIWYNNKWKYVKPKSFVPKVKRSSSFLSFFFD